MRPTVFIILIILGNTLWFYAVNTLINADVEVKQFDAQCKNVNGMVVTSEKYGMICVRLDSILLRK